MLDRGKIVGIEPAPQFVCSPDTWPGSLALGNSVNDDLSALSGIWGHLVVVDKRGAKDFEFFSSHFERRSHPGPL
jgi:hypothetical protein